MNQPLIVISDLHGAAKTMFSLLARYPDHRPVILGDMIDRGPDSKSIVEWAMKNRVLVTMGNHEHMAVDHYTTRTEYIPGTWKSNGGNKAVKSWHGHPPREVIAWMSHLPLFLILPEYPDLLLSHTGWGGPIITSVQDALWNRSFEFPKDGYYRILGHTRSKEAVVTESYAMVDTGAAYSGYGVLSAMLWPSREIVTQSYIDS